MIANAQGSASSSASRRVVNPRLLRALARCIEAAAVKDMAANVTEPLKNQLVRRAELTIDHIVDDFSGTARPLIPGPWPRPSTIALQLATALTIYANTTVQSGGLRQGLTEIATKLVEKAYKSSGL
jgi:hypothetical protein